MRSRSKIRALVLTGGGARAAYQAGVLKALAELLEEAGYREPPFQIFTGESAGAINASLLASHSEDFRKGTDELWRCWSEIEMDDIFATNPLSLLGNAGRWVGELGLGGLIPARNRAAFLLDTSPLERYLAPKISFPKIRELVRSGQLLGIGISATNYATGSSVTFFDGAASLGTWARSHRLGVKTELGLVHILASTAIPILFPAVRIGQTFYGDGAIRLKTPLSPAIHLGADSILAIGLRYFRTAAETMEMNQTRRMKSVSLADIAGVLLNAGFLDNLDLDLERLERINRTLTLIPRESRKEMQNGLRHIDALPVRPSSDLGRLASESIEQFGAMLRFLLKGLGTSKQSGWDLVSYLAFDKGYTSKLLRLGYSDGQSKKEELLELVSA